MAYLPGERAKIELTQKGNDQHQAVGHLEDGTMVVVEHAYKQIGSIVEVEFIRSLQTAAGKMMFAKLTQSNASQKKTPATNSESKPQRSPKAKGTAPVSQKAPRPTPASPARPARQKSVQQAQSTPAKKAQDAPARPARSRRPRSPEDSMVELANRQD
jgi:hypothetical protein